MNSILSFDAAFLGQMMLEHGETVLDYAQRQKLLPEPGGEQ